MFFCEIHHPKHLISIDLRYINLFNRNRYGLAHEPWSELLNTQFIGVLAEEQTIGSVGINNLGVGYNLMPTKVEYKFYFTSL